jgi:hypothetical protein
MPPVARYLARIDAQLAELEQLVANESSALDQRADRVSGWSVRQQVDHVVKVLALGLANVASGGKPQSQGCNLIGKVLMAADWLPRGVAKSPKSVLPEESPDAALLVEIRRLRAAYAAPELAASSAFDDERPVFPHPRFGGLTALQGVRFLGTHTHHHWKIVRDIRRAAGQPAAAGNGCRA